jgi:hypothetical protein
VAELVDALDSKSSFFGSAGSIPAPGTQKPSAMGAFLLKILDAFTPFFLLVQLLTDSVNSTKTTRNKKSPLFGGP